MGINSSTRRVTVVNDNESGVIRISESVVQKISQNQSLDSSQRSATTAAAPPPQQSSLPQQSQQQSTPQRSQLSSDQLYHSSSAAANRMSSVEHEEEVRRLERSWRSQIDELQKQNRQLWSTANEKLTANISAAELNLVNNKCEPVCRQNERQVVDCYQQNRSQPLKCSQEVKAFVDCVQQVRRSVLNRKG